MLTSIAQILVTNQPVAVRQRRESKPRPTANWPGAYGAADLASRGGSAVLGAWSRHPSVVSLCCRLRRCVGSVRPVTRRYTPCRGPGAHGDHATPPTWTEVSSTCKYITQDCRSLATLLGKVVRLKT